MSLPQCLHTLATVSFQHKKGISLRDEVCDLPKITAKSPPKQTDPNIR
jgi:hypothetical protein